MPKTEFQLGDTVSLKSREGLSPATPKSFKILLKLPNSEGRSLYRIRNNRLDHERVELGSGLVRIEE
ncbi:hypothetical protein C0081_20485 [Cohaesibacter celericrescens]|uniref:Uncharacterized protein n=2 Tax=Cohaesibacter celericrescens TaxID=2067669 RepID=A0A2N5XLF0_9HYPH|nr:hypothetical protein C0081_20485 [Cohaesibacter celericrescens]